MLTRKTIWFFIVPILVSAGCQDASGPEPYGWLDAEMVELGGDSTRSYEGTGTFNQGMYDVANQEWFTVYSRTLEDGDVAESIIVHRLGGRRPGNGEYDIGLLDQRDPNAAGFALMYAWTDGPESRFFAAESGKLTVSASSEKIVEGTFEVVAFEYCRVRATGTSEPCLKPWEPADDKARLTITGSFVAARDDSQPMEGIGPLVR
jgi:hypothetical protein